jgi:hypothetical protein
MLVLFAYFLVSLGAKVTFDGCSVSDGNKIDCLRFSEQDCENRGCCWQPAGQNSVSKVVLEEGV